MTEIMWRNWNVKNNITEAFLSLVQEYYPLTGPPDLTAPHPMFPSWYNYYKAARQDSIVRHDSSSDEFPSDDSMSENEG